MDNVRFRDENNHDTLGFAPYLKSVLAELLSQTGLYSGVYEELITKINAYRNPEGKPSRVSIRAIRSALAALHLKLGARPSEVKTMLGVSRREDPSPSIVVTTLLSYASIGTEGSGATACEEITRTFHCCVSRAFGMFFDLVASTAMTEWRNGDAEVQDQRFGTRTEPFLISVLDSVEDGLEQVVQAGFLVSLPENQVWQQACLAKIPIASQRVGSAELSRCSGLAMIMHPTADYAAFTELVFSIYRG